MTSGTEADVQKLLEELREFVAALSKAGEEGRQVLRALEPGMRDIYRELGVGEDGKLRAGAWGELAEAVRQGLQERIQGTLSAVRVAAIKADEPTDPRNVMFRAHASTPWIVTLIVLSISTTIALLVSIYCLWPGATTRVVDGKEFVPGEQSVLGMVILMGALGGSIHWMSSLVAFVGNGNLLRRWIPYYLLAPLQGAALALVVYLLLRVGVLSPAGSNATQHLNLLGLYAFAGLTGLFAKQAIEMLREVFNVMFKRVDAKDAGSGATRPQHTEPSAPAGGKGGESKPGGERNP